MWAEREPSATNPRSTAQFSAAATQPEGLVRPRRKGRPQSSQRCLIRTAVSKRLSPSALTALTFKSIGAEHSS